MRRWFSMFAPWLALLALLAMCELPEALIARSFRPSADFAVLLAAYVVSLRLGAGIGRFVRILLGLYAGLLLLYRVDRAAIVRFMGQDPLIYDQLLMARHLFVLLSDLWSWKLGALLIGIPVALAAAIWVCGRLLRALRPLAHQRVHAVIGASLLVFVCGATAAQDALPIAPTWLSPGLMSNLSRSKEIYASVQQQVKSSPYRAFDSLKLTRRPDIYLIFVESYGRVMIDRYSMRVPWRARIESMQRTLSAAGWSSASGFSVAPVAGGRSWLAEASILMGIHVDYEAVFHHLIGQIERVPNLVSLLQKQGYNTVLLAPADRVRKGVEETNYYNYRRVIRFNDLDYRGPKVGWGLVPDQYSLYHTDEHVLRSAARPLFFNFHMVTSHTPWKPVPTLVEDWRSLSDPNGPQFVEDGESALGMRMRRYAYREPRFMKMGKLRNSTATAYTETVLYDLELLERYLAGLKSDALVIVMGDHQPPFVVPETTNFESPIHLFARDPQLLTEFKAHGFKDGLLLAPEDPAAVRHEGMFSLVARALARCCSRSNTLPEYRAEGTHY